MDSKEFQTKITRLSELADEKKQLNERLDEIKKEHRNLEPDLLEFMGDSGIQKTKSQNGNTVFMKRIVKFSVPAGVRKQAIIALEENGLSDMIDIKPSDTRLSAWIKEQSEDKINDPEIPDFLDGLITAYSGTSLQVRGLTE